jgi:ABC-2 type transport system ATP-binding protein
MTLVNAIEIQGLSKSFGSIHAVREVSLSIRRGEMFALVGPDGAGKTTMIRMLCGITRSDAGSMSILGFDLRKQLPIVKERIGYLSQRFSLYGDLTVDENIEFFAEIHGVKKYEVRRNELLEFTRLTAFRDRLAEKLSGGMKQKLALACTLVHTPDVIFLDEPTTGVDPMSRRDFWKILAGLLKQGITMVMTTPYLDEAERCTRVGLMHEGRILVTDSPENLKRLMKGRLIEIVPTDIRTTFALLKQSDAVREVQAFGDRVHIVVDDEKDGLKRVKSLLDRSGIYIIDSRIISPSLENIFISLLTERETSERDEVHV